MVRRRGSKQPLASVRPEPADGVHVGVALGVVEVQSRRGSGVEERQAGAAGGTCEAQAVARVAAAARNADDEQRHAGVAVAGMTRTPPSTVLRPAGGHAAAARPCASSPEPLHAPRPAE